MFCQSAVIDSLPNAKTTFKNRGCSFFYPLGAARTLATLLPPQQSSSCLLDLWDGTCAVQTQATVLPDYNLRHGRVLDRLLYIADAAGLRF